MTDFGPTNRPPNQENQARSEAPVLPDNELEKSRVAPGLYKPIPEETLYEWVSLSRPFKPRKARFFTTVVVIVLLVSLILFFSGQFLPIAVVISVAFLSYVLAVVPPPNVSHKVTNYGIKVGDMMYFWEEMGRFWFEKKLDQDTLLVEIARFPGRLVMVIKPEEKRLLELLLAEVLLQEKPKLTNMEKAAKWLQDMIPLE